MCTNWDCLQTLRWKHHVVKGFLWPSYLGRHCPYLPRCYSWKEGRMCNEVGGTVCAEFIRVLLVSYTRGAIIRTENWIWGDAIYKLLKKWKNVKWAKKLRQKYFCLSVNIHITFCVMVWRWSIVKNKQKNKSWRCCSSLVLKLHAATNTSQFDRFVTEELNALNKVTEKFYHQSNLPVILFLQV